MESGRGPRSGHEAFGRTLPKSEGAGREGENSEDEGWQGGVCVRLAAVDKMSDIQYVTLERHATGIQGRCTYS